MFCRGVTAHLNAQSCQGRPAEGRLAAQACCRPATVRPGAVVTNERGQNKMTRWIFIVAAVIAAWAAVAPQAQAADYPLRAIRLVVPYPPGGGTDVMARRLADEMGKGLGQRVVVENVGGAGGNI